jgi:hypothetical protein
MQTLVRPPEIGTAPLGRQARPARKGSHHVLRLFLIDLAIFATFVLVMDVPLTGLAVHEWLGIAIAIGLVVHLVQHTNWIVTTTRRIFSATSWRNRLNYLMMGVLFLAFVAVIASGLIISEVALPWLGITTNPASFWVWLHLASVSSVLWLTALHVALNWKWIATTVRRYVVKPLVSVRSRLRVGGGR